MSKSRHFDTLHSAVTDQKPRSPPYRRIRCNLIRCLVTAKRSSRSGTHHVWTLPAPSFLVSTGKSSDTLLCPGRSIFPTWYPPHLEFADIGLLHSQQYVFKRSPQITLPPITPQTKSCRLLIEITRSAVFVMSASMSVKHFETEMATSKIPTLATSITALHTMQRS